MSSTATPTAAPTARGLVAAAHPGPALAVTALTGLLAVAQGLDTGTGALVVVAVLAGQLFVGWSNDLVDVARDRRAGRTDKPLATGAGRLVDRLDDADVGEALPARRLGLAVLAQQRAKYSISAAI